MMMRLGQESHSDYLCVDYSVDEVEQESPEVEKYVDGDKVESRKDGF